MENIQKRNEQRENGNKTESTKTEIKTEIKRTHRCPESVKNKMHIKLKDELIYNTDKWELYQAKYDFDYATWYLQKIAEIKYCPFCGERLGSKIEDNKDILSTEK